MPCWDYLATPMIMGLILGPIADSQLRRAPQISLDKHLDVFQTPGFGHLACPALGSLGGTAGLQATAAVQSGRCVSAI